MKESKKEEIYRWIIENVKKPTSISDIARRIGISWPTVDKWVHVLNSEGKITIIEFGNMKLVVPKR